MRNRKIRTQIIYYFSLAMIITIVLQITLYTILRIRSNSIISTIFESIAQNIVEQIEDLNTDVAEISSRLSTHPNIQNSLYKFSHQEIIQQITGTQELLDDYRERNKNIVYLGVINKGELWISSESKPLYDNVREMIKTLEDNPRTSKPIYPASIIRNGKVYFGCVTPIFPVDIKYYSPVHPKNYIVCLYEIYPSSYSLHDFIDDSMISLQITDASNRILLSPDIENHGKTIYEENSEPNIFSRTIEIPSVKWKATISSPINDAKDFFDISLSFVIFMLIINILFLIIMLKLFNGIIIHRIAIISNEVKKIPSNSLDYRLLYPYKDEFSEMTDIINHTLDKINSLNSEKRNTMKKMHRAELLQRETQLVYLNGQVSPHFLYNSMAHIHALALQNKSKEITELVLDLSQVFRYFSNNRPFTTIKQDIDCTIHYFNIINSRRFTPLEIKCELESDLCDIPCFKMTYQPIIENILNHAYKYNENGLITIRSIHDKENAIIEISDTGKGFSEKALKELTENLQRNASDIPINNHTGLLNVDMRLKLYYGNNAGVKIMSGANESAVIRVIFPKKVPDKEFLPPNFMQG